jgi:hypothetical protein
MKDIVQVSTTGDASSKKWNLYLSLDGPSDDESLVVGDVSDMVCDTLKETTTDCNLRLLTAHQFLSELVETNQDDVLIFSSVSPYMRSPESILTSGRRGRYVKFTLGGFKGNKWTSQDITTFDTAVHESFDTIHGKTDGMYFGGEDIYKIWPEDDAVETDSIILGRRTSRHWDIGAKLNYICLYCPDDDSAMESDVALSSFGLGKQDKMDKDPALSPKALIALSNQLCKVLTETGIVDFSGIDYCSASPSSPEEMAELVLNASEDDLTSSALKL